MINGRDSLVKRVTLYAVAFTSVIAALALVNKFIIADPINRAITDERRARQAADVAIINELRWISTGQRQVLGSVQSLGEGVSDLGDAVDHGALTRNQAANLAGKNLEAIQRVNAKLDSVLRVQVRRSR